MKIILVLNSTVLLSNVIIFVISVGTWNTWASHESGKAGHSSFLRESSTIGKY